jgi:cellulose synthase/poly-beta-1,6-N-acetylglucosamine synthase-like glycosyltransferase
LAEASRDAELPSPPPRFAVVVPAHGDHEPLRRLLDTLPVVEWPRDRLHVVVALDGPDPVLEKVVREAGVNVVVLPSNQGSYAARNAAIDALPEVDLVAFTDADCILTRDWLRHHAVALQSADMSGGGIEVTMRPRPSAAEYVDRMRHLNQKLYVTVDGYAATANLAVRRSVLDKLRFDPRLRSGGDNDFGTRAGLAGFSLVYTPEALVQHPARQTDAEVMTKIRRICGGIRDNPARWETRRLRDLKFTLQPGRTAWGLGYSRNPFWCMHVVVLQYRCERAVHRAVDAVRADHGWPDPPREPIA